MQILSLAWCLAPVQYRHLAESQPQRQGLAKLFRVGVRRPTGSACPSRQASARCFREFMCPARVRCWTTLERQLVHSPASWKMLSSEEKNKDRAAVRVLPAILPTVGFFILRMIEPGATA